MAVQVLQRWVLVCGEGCKEGNPASRDVHGALPLWDALWTQCCCFCGRLDLHGPPLLSVTLRPVVELYGKGELPVDFAVVILLKLLSSWFGLEKGAITVSVLRKEVSRACFQDGSMLLKTWVWRWDWSMVFSCMVRQIFKWSAFDSVAISIQAFVVSARAVQVNALQFQPHGKLHRFCRSL